MANLIRARQTLPVNRRRLLLDLALGTGAFVGLAGCGEQAKAQTFEPCDTPIPRDGPLLETIAVMEDIAARTYQAAEGILSPDLRPAAAAFAAHHLAHKQDANAKLLARGATLPAWVEDLNLDGVDLSDDLAILRYALTAERQAVNAYLSLIGQFADPELRIRAADILGCEVAHVVALRAVLPPPDGTGDILSAAAFDFITDLVRPPPTEE